MAALNVAVVIMVSHLAQIDEIIGTHRHQPSMTRAAAEVSADWDEEKATFLPNSKTHTHTPATRVITVATGWTGRLMELAKTSSETTTRTRRLQEQRAMLGSDQADDIDVLSLIMGEDVTPEPIEVRP